MSVSQGAHNIYSRRSFAPPVGYVPLGQSFVAIHAITNIVVDSTHNVTVRLKEGIAFIFKDSHAPHSIFRKVHMARKLLKQFVDKADEQGACPTTPPTAAEVTGFVQLGQWSWPIDTIQRIEFRPTGQLIIQSSRDVSRIIRSSKPNEPYPNFVKRMLATIERVRWHQLFNKA